MGRAAFSYQIQLQYLRMSHKVFPIWWMGLLLAGLAMPASAQQGYPARVVRLIVPFAPGGSVDFMGRAAAKRLTEQTGQSFVVDNRAGGGGVAGTDLVAKSTPDGYTLLLGHVSPLAINPNLEKVPYNPISDFTGISLLSTSHFALVVHPALPATSVRELIALAKSHPGKINYASAGQGTNTFLITEFFKTRTGIDIVHVPYKGSSPAAIAILSGESQMMFSGVTPVLQHVRAGKLRALAMTSPKRSPQLPGVPTLTEIGIDDISVDSWTALVAPVGIPRDVIARLNAEVLQFSATPQYREELAREAIEPVTSTPERYGQFIRDEVNKWRRDIQAAKVKLN